jgi:hypothetical protein
MVYPRESNVLAVAYAPGPGVFFDRNTADALDSLPKPYRGPSAVDGREVA